MRTVPNPYLRLLGRAERSPALDRLARLADRPARGLVAREPLRRFFAGDATGVPLHLVVKDAPFGAWFMAQFLDLYPDSRRAARRLVGLGLLGAAPAAVTGWAEWAGCPDATRRVGVLHAAATGAATAVFFASWATRARGRERTGIRLSRCGAAILVAGGFLGGHVGRGR
ncbi:DUF2231 domain-containing protein [Amycolatopsis sp. NPDC003865]